MKKFSLRWFNIFFLAVISFCCLLLIANSMYFSILFKRFVISSDQYIAISRAALDLQEASDYLTDEARLFVLTAEPIHLFNYFKEVEHNKRREIAITKITSIIKEENAVKTIENALKQSKELEKQELYAMKLIYESHKFSKDETLSQLNAIKSIQLYPEDEKLSDEYKDAKAWVILFSKDYMQKKTEIRELKNKASEIMFNLSEATQQNGQASIKRHFTRMLSNIILIFLLNVVFFVFIITFVIKPILRNVSNIQDHKKFSETRAKELNILSLTYNKMYDKTEASEVLLRHKAEHDELTGLINRAAFNQVKKALSSYTKNPISLILIDVDFFKLKNDTYGHLAGDAVLKLVASVLLEHFRSKDYVARVGGDEFAVIMTDCDHNIEKTTELITLKMNSIKDKLFNQKDTQLAVTLSAGIAISANGYSEMMYEQADQALYQVKRSGRNNFAFYKSSVDSIQI